MEHRGLLKQGLGRLLLRLGLLLRHGGGQGVDIQRGLGCRGCRRRGGRGGLYRLDALEHRRRRCCGLLGGLGHGLGLRLFGGHSRRLGLPLRDGCGGRGLLGQRRLKGVHIAGGCAVRRAAEDGVDVQALAAGQFTERECAAVLFTHSLFSSRFWEQKKTVNRPMGTHSLLVLIFCSSRPL